MAKVNMIAGDGNAFTTSLKRSREMVAAGTAQLAPAVKAGPRKAAKKAPVKAAKKATYRTRSMKAKK